MRTMQLALVTGQPYVSLQDLTPNELRRLTAVWNDIQRSGRQ